MTALEYPNTEYQLRTSFSRQVLDQQIEKVHPLIKIPDAETLVFAVGAHVVDVRKDSGDAEGGNAGDAQILTVTGAGIHHGNDRQAAVKFSAESFHLMHHRRMNRRGGSGHGF